MDFQEFISPGWIGLAITIIGFISYYLGKIVLDFYPSKEDKVLHHIVGFILFLIYFLIPASLIYYFKEYLIFRLNWGLFFLFWLIYGLLYLYIHIKSSIFKVSRGQVSKVFMKKFKEGTSLFGIDITKKSYAKRLFTEIPSQRNIILLGYVLIFLVSNIILFFNYFFIRVLIFLIVLPTFNNLLILHNASKIIYPDVILEDIRGKKYSGKIIKQDENYILLINEKSMYTFPRENVKIIRKNIKIDIKKTEDQIENVAKKTKHLLDKYLNNIKVDNSRKNEQANKNN